MKKRNWLYFLLVSGLVGVADASYLTWEHYRSVLPPCHVNWMTQLLGTWVDCGRVLTSQWAQIGPVPTAALGLLFYLGIVGWGVVELIKMNKINKINELIKTIKINKKIGEQILMFVNGRSWYQLLALMAGSGIITSSFLVYLMLVVIKSICLYCLLSAVNTVVIGYCAYRVWSKKLWRD